MSFFKTLFGGKEVNSEEKKQAQDFDRVKYEGVRALRNGQVEQAIHYFRHALDLEEDLEIHDHLSVAYIQHNDLQLAYEQLEILAKFEPDNQEIYLRMARVAYMMEDYDLMSTLCEKIIAVNQDNADAYCLFARAYIGKNDMAMAVSMLNKAILLDKNFGEAYLLRGDTLLRQGDIERADTDAMLLLQHTQDNEDVFLLKARIEKKKGNADEAISYYDQVTDVNPFCLQAYQERALIKQELGDRTGAQEDFLKVKELDEEMQENLSVEGIEQKVMQSYRNIDPYGIFSS